MKKNKFLALALVALCAGGLCSCNPDKDIEDDLTTFSLTADTPYLVENYTQADTSAVYGHTFSLTLEGTNCIPVGGVSPMNEAFVNVLPASTVCKSSATIVEYGKAKSISAIKSIPSSGYASSVTLQKHYGYVVKVVGEANVNSYNNPNYHDPADMYLRFYVEDELDNGGYSIVVQYPFTVTE